LQGYPQVDGAEEESPHAVGDRRDFHLDRRYCIPVHKGKIEKTPDVDVKEEVLERVRIGGYVAPLLNAKGLGYASSMVIGEIFDGHLPGFGRLDMSLKPGLWFVWENEIGEEELKGMMEMA